MDIPAAYLERIRAMRPDLTIKDVCLNSEGMVNDVVIVNGTWVFRFAKSEWGRAALADEVRVLDHIAVVTCHCQCPCPSRERPTSSPIG